MLSRVSWVWAAASPTCRVSEWVMLAVPETKIVAYVPHERAMARENFGTLGAVAGVVVVGGRLPRDSPAARPRCRSAR